MKGLILAGGTGSRLWPVTKAVSKQLVPVYDKPMIYYPLSTLILGGVRELAIISSQESLPYFQALFGPGDSLGLDITYLTQKEPRGLADAYLVAEKFLGGSSSIMILGDNLFHGPEFGEHLGSSYKQEGGLIFGYRVSNPNDYGVVSFDEFGKVESIEEKPARPKSEIAIPGLYFLDGSAPERAGKLAPSERGELEIADLLKSYMFDFQLEVELLPRSTVWLDTGNAEAMAEATEYVRVIQKRQSQMVGSPEEVSWRMGLIDSSQLERLGRSLQKSAYGQHLLKLAGAEIG